MTPEQTREAAIAYLEERAQMVRDGFPLCYKEKGVESHCDSCITLWRMRKETHADEEKRRMASRKELHTHNSIPNYTGGEDEGCIICIKNIAIDASDRNRV